MPKVIIFVSYYSFVARHLERVYLVDLINKHDALNYLYYSVCQVLNYRLFN